MRNPKETEPKVTDNEAGERDKESLKESTAVPIRKGGGWWRKESGSPSQPPALYSPRPAPPPPRRVRAFYHVGLLASGVGLQRRNLLLGLASFEASLAVQAAQMAQNVDGFSVGVGREEIRIQWPE